MTDITLRALQVLGAVDIVAAEDTRNSIHLLQHHGLHGKKLIALHQHNERASSEKLVSLLKSGQSVALITDAGTPAVSDPGALVVEAVREAGCKVIPVPGANAAVAALSASGLASPHFLFYGFLPVKQGARCKALEEVREYPCTLLFYEAPHRVAECVEDMVSVLGKERQIVFARELTKLFEDIHRCTLGTATAWLNNDPNNMRGEFVLLVSGSIEKQDGAMAEAEKMLRILLAELPLKQAVQLAAKISGAGRNELYARALEIKSKPDSD